MFIQRKREKLYKVVYNKNGRSTTTLNFSAVHTTSCTPLLTFHHERIPRQKKILTTVPSDTRLNVYLLKRSEFASK